MTANTPKHVAARADQWRVVCQCLASVLVGVVRLRTIRRRLDFIIQSAIGNVDESTTFVLPKSIYGQICAKGQQFPSDRGDLSFRTATADSRIKRDALVNTPFIKSRGNDDTRVVFLPPGNPNCVRCIVANHLLRLMLLWQTYQTKNNGIAPCSRANDGKPPLPRLLPPSQAQLLP